MNGTADPWPEGLPALAWKPGTHVREPVSTFTLENGLTVWALGRSGLPLLSIGLVLLGGRSLDTSDLPGLSALLAAGLKEGTETFPSEVLFKRLQEHGAELLSSSSADSLNLTIDGLSSGLGSYVEILASLVTEPAFLDAGVARVRALAEEELETHESEPSFLASRAFSSVVFGDHPYSFVSPTRQTIARVTRDMLGEESRKRFRPERSALIAIGDLNPDAVCGLARQFFGGWRAGGPSWPEVARVPPSSKFRKVYCVPRPGSVQTYLMTGNAGVSRKDKEAHALSLAVTLYGGAFTSRLVTNLRTQKGYTYAPGAVSRWHRGRGYVRTVAAVRNEVTAAALNEIFYEMNRMGATPILQEELERGRMRDLGLRVTSLQTHSGLLSELSDLFVEGLDPDALHEPEDALFKITPAEIRAVSRHFLSSSRAHVVAVGDPKTIKEELSPFGEVAQL